MECLVKNYKKGDILIINIPEDNKIVDLLEYSELRLNSYENLFSSYLNNTNEEASKMNLDKFLDKYTLTRLENENNKNNLLNSIIENNPFLKDYVFSWEITFIDKKIKITIEGRK